MLSIATCRYSLLYAGRTNENLIGTYLNNGIIL